MHWSEMERAQAATMRGPAQPATYRRTGPIALACYTAGSLTAALPGPGATTGTVITHLTAHRSGVLAGTMLMFLALPFLSCFSAIW